MNPPSVMSAKKAAKKKAAAIPIPATDWRTTDRDEILRRVQRARDEKHAITNLHPEHPIFFAETLRETLDEWDVSKAEVSRMTGIPSPHLTDMKKSRLRCTLEYDLRFGR
jgi:hypothetical protein